MELFFYKTTPGHERLNITTSGAAVCNVDSQPRKVGYPIYAMRCSVLTERNLGWAVLQSKSMW
jgi:hypothetical protein